MTKMDVMRLLRARTITVTEAINTLKLMGCVVSSVQVSTVPVLDYMSRPVETEPYVTFTVLDVANNREYELSATEPVAKEKV